MKSTHNLEKLLADIDCMPSNLSIPIASLPRPHTSLLRSISYVGFTFSQRNVVESKIYYLPNNEGVNSLAPHLPSSFLSLMSNLDRCNRELGCKLYDSSCLNSGNSPIRYRVVWTVPYATRCTSERTHDFLQRFKEANRIKIPFADMYKLNDAIETLNPGALSPLFLIGGEIDETGQFACVKFDWDADIVYNVNEKRESTCYNSESALAISVRVIEKYVSSSEIDDYHKMFRMLLSEEYYLHSWGMNLSSHGADDVKVYFKSKNPKLLVASDVLCGFLSQKGLKDAETFKTLMQYYIDRKWKYAGFCLSFNNGGIKSIKTYVISPLC